MQNVYLLENHERAKVQELYKDWEHSMITSYLQGYMGNAYVVDKENVASAMIEVGDFCFLAGVPERRLVDRLFEVEEKESFLLLPQSKEWEVLIETVYGKKAQRRERYKIKKEPDVFCKDKLLSYTQAMPTGYELCEINQELYKQIMENEWSRDLCSVFQSYEEYQENGLGTAVLYDGRVVAGASSYTRYKEGIEIEIDTEISHRRKGLALACGAALILNCLNRSLYPGWDAHDMRSVKVAEKLGYHLQSAYTAYDLITKVKRQRVTHEFDPIFNAKSRILMLGTMPSPKSREVGFYYGHPRNRFWKVVSDVCKEPAPGTREEKKAFALKHGIAVWDVLSGCEITGADDSSIRNPIANDLSVILKQADIQAVFATGTKAAQLYKRYCFKETGIEIITLPSTSPANCTVTYEQLYEAYSIIRTYL